MASNANATPQAVVNNLQGHQVVLQQELAEINADIATLQGMHARYSSQNGIYFDSAVHNLIALRCEKEALFNNISGQVAALSDTIQQSTMLAQNLSRLTSGGPGAAAGGFGFGAAAAGGFGGAGVNTTFNNPNASTMHSNVSAFGGGGGSRMAGGVGSSSFVHQYPHHSTVGGGGGVNASCAHCPVHGGGGGASASFHGHSGVGVGGVSIVPSGAVNINTPGGLVVTTNSSILANSPRRIYRQ